MPNPEPNKWAGILMIAGTVLLIIIMVILTIVASYETEGRNLAHLSAIGSIILA